MHGKTKRVFIVAGVLIIAAVGISGWTTAKVVAWVRDLPNRVVIDRSAIESSIGQAMTESYHLALRDGDTNIQLQILNEQFVPLIRQDDEGAAWIRKEYGDDINALVDSDDPAASTAASNVVSMLEPDERS
jgi:hypothetical protein